MGRKERLRNPPSCPRMSNFSSTKERFKSTSKTAVETTKSAVGSDAKRTQSTNTKSQKRSTRFHFKSQFIVMNWRSVKEFVASTDSQQEAINKIIEELYASADEACDDDKDFSMHINPESDFEQSSS